MVNVTASSNPILLSNKGTHHDLIIVLSVSSWRAGPVCEEGENTPVKPFKFAGAPAAFPVHWFHSHTRQLRVFPLKLLFNILVYFLSIIYHLLHQIQDESTSLHELADNLPTSPSHLTLIFCSQGLLSLKLHLFLLTTHQPVLIIYRQNPVNLPDYFMGIFLALILILPAQHWWLQGVPTWKSHQEHFCCRY